MARSLTREEANKILIELEGIEMEIQASRTLSGEKAEVSLYHATLRLSNLCYFLTGRLAVEAKEPVPVLGEGTPFVVDRGRRVSEDDLQHGG